MKTIKSLILAASVALAFGAFHAEAQSFPTLPFTVTNQFEPINFNMTVYLQLVSTNTNVAAVVSEKMTTATLLKSFAIAFGVTNWPAGAKLALELQSGDVYVVDKTGKKPIFDLSNGTNDIEGTTNSIYDEVFFRLEPLGNSLIAGKVNQRGSLTDSEATYMPIQFEYKDVQAATDMFFYGLDVSVYKLTSKQVATQTDYAYLSGSGTLGASPLGAIDAVSTGQFSGSGSWKPGAE